MNEDQKTKPATKTAVALFILFILCIIMAVIWGLQSFKAQNDLEWRLFEYQKARFEYLFDGAQKRNLLDLCENKSGVTGVWFKEDCKR